MRGAGCTDGVQEMQRALFVYAKLNPGLTYVQGMNELLAPIYYTLRTDVDEDAREAAEADAFWCFIDLMTEFRDNYCKQLVCASSSGLMSKRVGCTS